MENNEIFEAERREAEGLTISNVQQLPDSDKAIEYLVELGKKDRDFKVTKIGNRVFVNTRNGDLQEIEPFETPIPSIFSTYTLSGLVRFLEEDIDGLFQRFERLYVKVLSPTEVTVYTTYTANIAKGALW